MNINRARARHRNSYCHANVRRGSSSGASVSPRRRRRDLFLGGAKHKVVRQLPQQSTRKAEFLTRNLNFGGGSDSIGPPPTTCLAIFSGRNAEKKIEIQFFERGIVVELSVCLGVPERILF